MLHNGGHWVGAATLLRHRSVGAERQSGHGGEHQSFCGRHWLSLHSGAATSGGLSCCAGGHRRFRSTSLTAGELPRLTRQGSEVLHTIEYPWIEMKAAIGVDWRRRTSQARERPEGHGAQRLRHETVVFAPTAKGLLLPRARAKPPDRSLADPQSRSTADRSCSVAENTLFRELARDVLKL
jgi:hypothetical protein